MLQLLYESLMPFLSNSVKLNIFWFSAKHAILLLFFYLFIRSRVNNESCLSLYVG